MKYLPQKQNGFTLIELLLVISIIGLLASVFFVSTKSAREKAKIARAQLDVRAIQKGLILYLENQGTFDAVTFSCPSAEGGNNMCDQNAWNAGWFSSYVAQVPLDPWGNPYFFDGIPVVGFENDPSECGPWGTSVISFGPNRVLESINVPGPQGDDIQVYFDNQSRCTIP